MMEMESYVKHQQQTSVRKFAKKVKSNTKVTICYHTVGNFVYEMLILKGTKIKDVSMPEPPTNSKVAQFWI